MYFSMIFLSESTFIHFHFHYANTPKLKVTNFTFKNCHFLKFETDYCIFSFEEINIGGWKKYVVVIDFLNFRLLYLSTLEY